MASLLKAASTWWYGAGDGGMERQYLPPAVAVDIEAGHIADSILAPAVPLHHHRSFNLIRRELFPRIQTIYERSLREVITLLGQEQPEIPEHNANHPLKFEPLEALVFEHLPEAGLRKLERIQTIFSIVSEELTPIIDEMNRAKQAHTEDLEARRLDDSGLTAEEQRFAIGLEEDKIQLANQHLETIQRFPITSNIRQKILQPRIHVFNKALERPLHFYQKTLDSILKAMHRHPIIDGYIREAWADLGLEETREEDTLTLIESRQLICRAFAKMNTALPRIDARIMVESFRALLERITTTLARTKSMMEKDDPGLENLQLKLLDVDMAEAPGSQAGYTTTEGAYVPSHDEEWDNYFALQKKDATGCFEFDKFHQLMNMYQTRAARRLQAL